MHRFVRRLLYFVVLVSFEAHAATQPLCLKPSVAQDLSKLETALLPEASGMAVSRRFADRIYFHNDAGDNSSFYVTDASGQNTKKISIEGFEAQDFEDAAVGPCGIEKTCLFLADIGTTGNGRDEANIVVIEELERFPEKVTPLFVLKISYVRFAQNFEALAVHPNGDLVVFAKSYAGGSTVYPSSAFRVKFADWINATPETKLTFQDFGSVDLAALASGGSNFGKVITAADVSPDGKRLLLLTYENAFEFDIDLSTIESLPAFSPSRKDADYTEIKLTPLLQQEAVSYLPNGRDFLYTTEFDIILPNAQAPLMRVECKQ